MTLTAAAADLHPPLVGAPVDVEPGRAALGPVGVEVDGPAPRGRGGGHGPFSIIGAASPDPCAHADRPRHRLDPPPLLGRPLRRRPPALRRRAALRGPVDLRASPACGRTSSPSASPRPTASRSSWRGVPYPGAVEVVNRWHADGHFIHVTSHRDVGRPRRHGALAGAHRPGPRRPALLDGQDQPLRRARHRRPRRRRPGQPPRRPGARDRARDDRPPVEPRRLRGGGRAVRARLARARGAPGPGPRRGPRRASGRRALAHRRGGRHARPAPVPARASSPSGPSRTGAAPSASRASWTARSTSSSTASGSAVEVEGIEHVPAAGGALLVSNHAGALPPDAAMIAKAIKEEHPRPRPLHLTVEHFFRGYPGFSMLLPKIGARPGPPGQRPPPALRRGAARARLPRGAQGHREALQATATGCAASAAAGSSRRRCGPARRSSRSPSSAPRRRCPLFAQLGLLKRLTGLIYFPITPTFPHFGAPRRLGLPAGEVPHPLPAAGADGRPRLRRAVGGQGARPVDRRTRSARDPGGAARHAGRAPVGLAGLSRDLAPHPRHRPLDVLGRRGWPRPSSRTPPSRPSSASTARRRRSSSSARSSSASPTATRSSAASSRRPRSTPSSTRAWWSTRSSRRRAAPTRTTSSAR